MSRLTELYDIYKKQGTARQKADVAASDKMYDTQRQQTQNAYNRQIKDTNNSYEDMYRENAVQKLINEREIAEDMAGLGLTDSGLNRTQQTAVQLSYANGKNKIDVNRQKAVDTLAASLADAISSIDANKLAAAEKIRSSYESGWNSAAQSTYAKELEEQTKQQKQYYDYSLKALENQQKAYEKQLQTEKGNNYIIKTNNGLLSKNYSGTLKENGVDSYRVKQGEDTYIRYVDNNSGKYVNVPLGVNPYTGDNNASGSDRGDTALAYRKYDAFENGYQPKGVFYDGKDYGWVSFSGMRDEINGNMQNVHRTKDGSLWIWDGRNNRYIKYIQ